MLCNHHTTDAQGCPLLLAGEETEFSDLRDVNVVLPCTATVTYGQCILDQSPTGIIPLLEIQCIFNIGGQESFKMNHKPTVPLS